MSASDDVVDWSAFSAPRSSLLGELWKYPTAFSECIRSEYDTWRSLRSGIAYLRGGIEAIGGAPDSGASSVRNRLQKTTFGEDEFLFLNLMEAHTPYYTPPGFDGPNQDNAITVSIKDSLGLETPPNGTVEAYFDASRYLASIYREIFEELDSSFDYIITVSDHGEMLGESETWNHTYGLFPEIVNIPLVISGKNMNGKCETTVSHLDLHKTLLDISGIEHRSRGKNLLDNPQGNPVLTEYHGLIPVAVRRLEEENVDPDILNTYDSRLSGLAVPPSYYGHETNSGYVGSGSANEDPKEVLSNLQGSISERTTGTEQNEMSEEVIDRLDDLGYV